MPCVQCCRCQSSEVVRSRWRFNATDLWTAATLRRPYRCTACLHRFGDWATFTGKPVHRRTKWRKSATLMHSASLALALACALLAGSPAHAEIVYTTATSAGTASNSNLAPTSLTGGYKIGDFGSSTTPSFNFSKANGKQLSPGIRFTTATFTDTQRLTGINLNLFMAGGTGGANSINSATMHWDLYQLNGTTSTQVGSFTSALNPIAWISGGVGSSVYQNNSLTLAGAGSSNLMSDTKYSLLLTSIDGITALNSPNNAQLYWSYYSNPSLAGGSYIANQSGYVTGPYSGTSTFTPENLAFDITIQSAPEPGTLLLGLIASSAGGGAVWWKRRKRPSTQSAESEPERV